MWCDVRWEGYWNECGVLTVTSSTVPLSSVQVLWSTIQCIIIHTVHYITYCITSRFNTMWWCSRGTLDVTVDSFLGVGQMMWSDVTADEVAGILVQAWCNTHTIRREENSIDRAQSKSRHHAILQLNSTDPYLLQSDLAEFLDRVSRQHVFNGIILPC